MELYYKKPYTSVHIYCHLQLYIHLHCGGPLYLILNVPKPCKYYNSIKIYVLPHWNFSNKNTFWFLLD